MTLRYLAKLVGVCGFDVVMLLGVLLQVSFSHLSLNSLVRMVPLAVASTQSFVVCSLVRDWSWIFP